MSARKPTRVFVTVALDVDSDWYDRLDPERPQDAVARHVTLGLAAGRVFRDSITIVNVEASEVL